MGVGPWAMGVFIVLIAVVLIGAFAGVWLHDRRRSDVVSDDRSRHHTDRPQ